MVREEQGIRQERPDPARLEWMDPSGRVPDRSSSLRSSPVLGFSPALWSLQEHRLQLRSHTLAANHAELMERFWGCLSTTASAF